MGLAGRADSELNPSRLQVAKEKAVGCAQMRLHKGLVHARASANLVCSPVVATPDLPVSSPNRGLRARFAGRGP